MRLFSFLAALSFFLFMDLCGAVAFQLSVGLMNFSLVLLCARVSSPSNCGLFLLMEPFLAKFMVNLGRLDPRLLSQTHTASHILFGLLVLDLFLSPVLPYLL